MEELQVGSGQLFALLGMSRQAKQNWKRDGRIPRPAQLHIELLLELARRSPTRFLEIRAKRLRATNS